jgi:Tfp pilus assembly protein, ATPase PilM
MAFKLSFGSKNGVGIDIGSDSIKVLRLSKSGHKYRVLDSDVIGLPGGAVSGGVINDKASVASYLKSSFSRLGIKEKNVVIAVPCKHVIIKTIEMPKMKEGELDSSIYYEAQQYITYDINEVFYDYVVLGESQTDPNNNMIMIVAGKKDIINNQTELIRECGLNPFMVDVDCIAVENHV